MKCHLEIETIKWCNIFIIENVFLFILQNFNSDLFINIKLYSESQYEMEM